MNIGQNIKKARLEKGYTQEELANLVGVKKSAVAKWENGRVSNIKRSNLSMLANVLNINPNILLDNIAEKKPVEGANELADVYFDPDLRKMISEYQRLNEDHRKQVKEYISFLLSMESN